jgi:alkylation response protein AidB-like acyl-CoA dehydrogenase
MVATFGLGIARGAYEAALVFAREKRHRGKTLITQDAVAPRLTDVLTKIEATRSIVWKTASAADHPPVLRWKVRFDRPAVPHRENGISNRAEP